MPFLSDPDTLFGSKRREWDISNLLQIFYKVGFRDPSVLEKIIMTLAMSISMPFIFFLH